MKKRLIIKIQGLVQGVFFRASTRDMALKLGITGLVKNEPDGSVYIEAEGPDDALDQFVAWCKKGPRMAHVSGCEIKEDTWLGYQDFRVERN